MALSTLVVEVFALLSIAGFADAAVNSVLDSDTTTAGKTIRFWCEVTGETFDGWYDPSGTKMPTDMSERKHVESIDTKHYLSIKHVDAATDGGVYTCKGSINQDTFTLNIGYIADPPTKQKLVLNKPGTVKLDAHGFPPPTYEWKKDGVKLDPNSDRRITQLDDGSLQISSVTVADEGKYDCRVTQRISHKDVSIQVSVIEKPKITVAPQRTRVLTEGYNTTFKCNATGRPEPTIKWIDQNGREIDSVVDSRYSVSNGYLTITGVLKKDADKTYTCEAKNDDDDATATGLITKVLVAPKLRPLSDMTKNKGEKVTLLCEATAGDDPMVVVWKKDGNKFRDQDQQQRKSTIVFERVDVENSGKYTCEATNGAKDDKGDTIVVKEEINLFVKSPPKLNAQKSSTPVYSFVGNPNPVKIVCEFFGYPLPNITMTQNGTELVVGERTVTYEITDTKEDSFQTFHCLAINKNGNASHTVELKRAGAPEAVKNLKGTPTCKSIAVKWNKPNFDGGMAITKYVIKITDENGTEVVAQSVDAPSTEYTHTQDIEKEKQYKIQASAQSAFPKRGPVETVTVTTTKYCAPSKPIITSVPPTTLTKLKFKLEWRKPDSDGGDSIIKYRVSYQSYQDGILKENKTVGETEKTEIEIDDTYLKAGRTYTFKVTAINEGGASDAGMLRLVVSPEAVPDDTVTDTTRDPQVGARTQDGLSAGVIAAIVIVIILIILIAIDLFCCYFNSCGLFFCCHKTLCGGGGGGGSATKHKGGKGAKTSELENLKPAPEHV